jgi:tetratricopeptide (TPR) repeat protein
VTGCVRLLLLVATLALLAPPPAAAQPTEADVYVAEGIVALDDKRYADALRSFQTALAREPGHVEALYYSGVAYMGLDRPKDAIPLLEQARAKSRDVAIAFQLGLAYFAAKDFRRAEPLLEEAYASEPQLSSLGYYVGFLRYQREDYQGALQAFRAGRTDDPNIAQLTRIYTGLALAQLGLPSQAQAEVEQALRLQPASPLTGPAERVRDAIVTTSRTNRRFRLDLRAGFFYDDNASVEPDAKDNDPDVVALREGRRHTTGELFSLRAEYDWFRSGPWTSTLGYSFFTTYDNDLPSFNIRDHTGTLSLSHRTTLAGLPLLAGVAYAFDYVTLGDKELVQRNSGSAYAVLLESSRHLTNVLGRVDVKQYSETRPLTRDEFQDGVNWLVGVTHVVRFAADRHYVKAGYQFDVEDTDGRNYQYHGHRFLAGAGYTLPWKQIRLSYDFDLHYRDYTRTNTVYPLNREESRERSDREYTNVARVDVPLPQDFSITLEYVGKIARSNIAVFEYTRNVYTIYVNWLY